ncbi:hypothetical protein [Pseudoruegeria sp. SK021]|uniref:hypothetical protein n=1 Tax=Pseudoruegeria sp. SK021 TaxID=1933035 RepID=UPI000A255D2D|nr:hypothetical protein [Pseudoruegeria sp. SK021]OSP54199.1 hypothetical protein BV911_13665 [Pseudoruegeria sp. SK021]
MTNAPDLWAGTAVKAAGITEATATGQAVLSRANIFAMTQDAEDAVLRPADPGAWPHGMRAALACRIACLNDAQVLADHYGAMMGTEHSALANPLDTGADDDLAPLLAFMDKVAARPRDITADDISGLLAAGVSDADIVRLTELNAFLGYQIRLVAGLTLLSEASA